MPVRAQFNAAAALGLVAIVSLWPLTLFDRSAPREYGRPQAVEYGNRWTLGARIFLPTLSIRWPAGIYLGSLIEARAHHLDGHPAYLLGMTSRHGWWYYFPVVAAYKVPIGVALVILCGFASLARKNLTWPELGLLAPMLAIALLVTASGINIGFRHALPAYVFLLIFASRCASLPNRAWTGVAWAGVLAAAAHALSYHPDYLSYFNAPWRKPYLAVNDSNVDWGQATREAARWLARHPQPGRVIHFDDFDECSGAAALRYLGDRVRHVPRTEAGVPSSGVLIISPAWVAGLYGRTQGTARLRAVEPTDTIGHCLLVYDLDALPPPAPTTTIESK
jgi:hypothetical protein